MIVLFRALALLAVAGLCLGAEERDENGLLYKGVAMAIRPWSGPFDIQSEGYPRPSTHKLEQGWRYLSYTPDSDGPSALELICHDIHIPQGDCQENSLLLKDGQTEKRFCAEDAEPFRYLSKTNELNLKLTVGDSGGALVRCTVQNVLLQEDGRPVRTTTTTTPKPPVKLTYLDSESYEVDSDEHGLMRRPGLTNCPCGWANKVTSRIVNGTAVSPNEFPFLAGLMERETKWRFCGATIVTAKHALTAAHCTDVNTKLIPLSLLVGGHNIYKAMEDEPQWPTQVIDVKVVIQHEGWKPKHFVDDISLLLLAESIIFSPYVGPACLPHSQYDLQRKYIKVIGWGAVVFKGPGTVEPYKIDVRVVDREQCGRMYSHVRDQEETTHLCTYAKGKASCQGDSGGPVVWVDPDTNMYTLVGIVSFGRVCGDISPSVHTDVGAYLDWIHHFIQASDPAARMCKKRQA